MVSKGIRLAALGALCLVATAAPAAERWIVTEPTPEHFALLWKEGSIEAGSEVGRSFVRLTTDGRSHPSFAATRALQPKLDAQGRFVKLLLRIQGMQHLAGLELLVGSGALDADVYSFALPLYGDPEYNVLQDGAWTTVTLSFGTARRTGAPDRAALDAFGVKVGDDGKGRVQVDFGGLALVDEPAAGVVSFTFDDGYAEHLTAAKLLAARGWRGTFYVIPQTIDTPACLTSADLAELGRLGDVAAHAVDPFTAVPPNDLGPLLGRIQSYLVERGYAGGAQHLAYPLGKQEPRRIRPEVARRFATARIAGAGPETLPPADLHLLRAINVVDSMTPEEVGAIARRARDAKEWAILMFHWLPERAAKPTDYALGDFKRVLDEVAKAQVRVAPVSEVWETLVAPPPQAEIARRASRAAGAPPAAPAQ
jgi:peptidoglycan/xylan/chitin deacetylase (PgdA/CDA1 family)